MSCVCLLPGCENDDNNASTQSPTDQRDPSPRPGLEDQQVVARNFEFQLRIINNSPTRELFRILYEDFVDGMQQELVSVNGHDEHTWLARLQESAYISVDVWLEPRWQAVGTGQVTGPRMTATYL